MTTEEKINQLEAAFKAQIDELRKEVKPKFEVGRWYKDPKSLHMVCVQKENARLRFDGFGYGIACDGSWGNDLGLDGSEIPATDKEVEEALIKEAERRGFKEGVMVDKSSMCDPINKDKVILSSKYNLHEFIEKQNRLRIYGDTVFYQGKWAEIIKDEPIKVGGYEVKKVVEKDGCYYKIGCKKIADTSVGSLNIIMKSYNFKKVAFDGIEVNLETIEKILKM